MFGYYSRSRALPPALVPCSACRLPSVTAVEMLGYFLEPLAPGLILVGRGPHTLPRYRLHRVWYSSAEIHTPLRATVCGAWLFSRALCTWFSTRWWRSAHPCPLTAKTIHVANLAISRGRVPSTCYPLTGTPVLRFSPPFFGRERAVVYRLYQPRTDWGITNGHCTIHGSCSAVDTEAGAICSPCCSCCWLGIAAALVPAL